MGRGQGSPALSKYIKIVLKLFFFGSASYFWPRKQGIASVIGGFLLGWLQIEDCNGGVSRTNIALKVGVDTSPHKPQIRHFESNNTYLSIKKYSTDYI